VSDLFRTTRLAFPRISVGLLKEPTREPTRSLLLLSFPLVRLALILTDTCPLNSALPLFAHVITVKEAGVLGLNVPRTEFAERPMASDLARTQLLMLVLRNLDSKHVLPQMGRCRFKLALHQLLLVAVAPVPGANTASVSQMASAPATLASAPESSPLPIRESPEERLVLLRMATSRLQSATLPL
jgi:hypothetical protein